MAVSIIMDITMTTETRSPTSSPTSSSTAASNTSLAASPGLNALLAWMSPSYPVGAYTYSHGLEALVEAGTVADRLDLQAFVETVLTAGGGWCDAVLFTQAYGAADDTDTLDMIADLAAAFRATSETALESTQQGAAFLKVTRAAWPHPALDAFAQRRANLPIAQPVAAGLASALHHIPLVDALTAYLHGLAANLVSAGVRLIPLGQTDGQITTAILSQTIDIVATRALDYPLDALGTASPALEIASMHHEIQYTRLFRS